jgi:curli production assembly/transport component CsgE
MPHPIALSPARGPRHWWGDQVSGLLAALLLATMLGAPSALAQRPRSLPAQRKAPSPVVRKTPLAADTTHQLSMQKTEEALRLLLRADSVQHAQVQPGMEADAEGFVLDQTLTKAGREFYELFYSTFQSTTGLHDYTIVLSERPLRGTSSLISMNVNDTELLEIPLPTRTEQIEEAVTAAVETARGFLSEQQAQSTMMETPQTTGRQPTKP